MTTVRSEFPFEVRTTEHVWIDLPDGARLSAMLRLPIADHPVPAILEYVPYRKDDGTLARDNRQHDYLAGHGFGCVRVDIRGSGDSDGVLAGEYLATELDDGVDVIAWIAAQPWCTGKVGMMGISWGGFNCLQIAAKRPPALAAVVSVAATVDRYATDVHYKGGCLLGTDMLPWSSTMLCFNVRPPNPRIVGGQWRRRWLERLAEAPVFVHDWIAHQRRDEFWQHGSVCEDFSAIDCPVMSVGGFADGYTDTVFHLAERLQVPFRGIVGPWSHNYPAIGVPGPNIGFLQEVVDWFGVHLGPNHAAPDRATGDDPLWVWVQEWVAPATSHVERPGRWVSEPAWPSPNVEYEPLFLAPTGLSAGAPAPTSVCGRNSVSSGLRQGSWWGYAEPGQLPADQRLEEPAAFRFIGDPIEAATTILGCPKVHLRLAVDQPVALVAIRLCDVAPDGTSLQLSRGLLNLCHRNGHASPEVMVPGELCDVVVGLDAVAHDLRVGHRLELHVGTGLWPIAWPSPVDVELTVQLGQRSRLDLPVRAAVVADPLVPRFAEPETAADGATELIAPAHRRTLHEDMSTGTVVLTDHGDAGTIRFDASGTEMSSTATDVWEITRGDPLSAGVTCDRSWTVRWGEICAEVRTTSTMRCDATHFHTTDSVVALEDGQEIFASRREATRSRDHV